MTYLNIKKRFKIISTSKITSSRREISFSPVTPDSKRCDATCARVSIFHKKIVLIRFPGPRRSWKSAAEGSARPNRGPTVCPHSRCTRPTARRPRARLYRTPQPAPPGSSRRLFLLLLCSARKLRIWKDKKFDLNVFNNFQLILQSNYLFSLRVLSKTLLMFSTARVLSA